MRYTSMWINKNGRLTQSVDKSRTKFKTTISDQLLNQLQEESKKVNSNISYLLETGYVNLLATGHIQYNKKNRPNDRRDFRSTCETELYEQLKAFAKAHKLNLNDVIETAANYINPAQAKKENWRYRIERETK